MCPGEPKLQTLPLARACSGKISLLASLDFCRPISRRALTVGISPIEMGRLTVSFSILHTWKDYTEATILLQGMERTRLSGNITQTAIGHRNLATNGMTQCLNST